MTNDFEKSYTVLKGAVSKELCHLLREYVHFKALSKPNVRKNDALTGVHREYGDPLFETLLNRLTPQIEAATGLSLWPTLSFYYLYKNGQTLAKHKDRSSCQLVASLAIGADDDFKREQGSWPLFLDDKGNTEAISLDDGDILIFRGYETEHWRDMFEGKWFVSAIFAYVEKDSPFAFQKYDQRKTLGKPHVGMLRWFYGVMKNKLFR